MCVWEEVGGGGYKAKSDLPGWWQSSPLHWGYLLLLWLQVVFIVSLFPLFLKPVYCSWFCFILVFFTLAYKEIELYMNFHTSYVSWFSLFLLSVSLAPSPTVHFFFFVNNLFILFYVNWCSAYMFVLDWITSFNLPVFDEAIVFLFVAEQVEALRDYVTWALI